MTKKTVKLIVRGALLILFIAYLIYYIDPGDLITLVNNMQAGYLAVALALYLLNYCFRAYRYQAILRDIVYIEWPVAMKISLLHAFYNRILPARIGEISFIYMMNKDKQVPVHTAAAALVLFRLYDLLVCLELFFWGTLVSNISLREELLLFSVIAIAALIVCHIGLFVILGKAEKLNHNGKLAKLIRKYLDPNWRILFSWRTTAKLVLTSLPIWISLYSMFVVLLQCFKIPLSYMESFYAITMAVITNLLPVSGLGGFGAMELGWAFGFTQLGLEFNLAMTTGVLSNLFTFLATVLFGLIGFVLQYCSKPGGK